MKRKQVLYWITLIAFFLIIAEAVSSIYYFQTKDYDAPFAVVQLWQSVKNRLVQSGIFGKHKINSMYVDDDSLGYSLRKDTEAVLDCWGDKMKYLIDSNKERFIPDSEPFGRFILFLGGSYTFGLCVNERENYPYILAKEYWKNWKIRNGAVSGWGTSQAYLKLLELVESDNPPSMIIYAMIPHHITRNYLNRKWIESLAKSGRKLPHFEMINGNLVFQGIAGLSANIKNEEEVRNKEIELTSAFLSSMKSKCEERGIPFIVVLLPWKGTNTYPPSVILTMSKLKIPVLDLTKLKYEGIEVDKDKHPNPMDHRRIAKAIANSFISKMLLDLELQSSNG